jgi:hypothetical protein
LDFFDADRLQTQASNLFGRSTLNKAGDTLHDLFWAIVGSNYCHAIVGSQLEINKAKVFNAPLALVDAHLFPILNSFIDSGRIKIQNYPVNGQFISLFQLDCVRGLKVSSFWLEGILKS